MKRAGRAFLALVAGLWLTTAFTPCAMAMASVVPMPDANCLSGHMGGTDHPANIDAASTVDCNLPDAASPGNLASPVLDIPVAAASVIPLADLPIRHDTPQRYLRESVSIPPPPPLLRNSVLLI